MLDLVLANRNEVGLVEKDVGGLQHRIVQDAGHDLLLPRRLFLELRLPLKLAQGRERVENPRELRVLRHLGLDEERGLGRVDP